MVTVDSFNAATGEKLDRAHWKITARSLQEAEGIAKSQVENINRTIPSVRNEFIAVESYSHDICLFLKRGINCQGHRTALKQARGGNEGQQI